ncbi:LAME_0C06942g1_1 [Lachancea meyersii CBS 8951]|uniref:LAME_0C06942g1_1 n=1 Tax=Lachancea meyersii CBS 8951 TaxID=1266667 RepID=A0A1G4J2C5_9SACH|nr:LAME_0C06942g1_1 [Lachancea meyersii CBS 8951]
MFSRIRNVGTRVWHPSLLRNVASRSRAPPKSLLQRQAKRRGDMDSTTSSQLIVSSLKDIFSIFNPSGYSQEDEDLESNARKEAVAERIEHGELRSLYLQKFSAVRVSPSAKSDSSVNDLRIPTRSLTVMFPQLSQQDRELIDVSLGMIPKSTDWREIPLVQKQMLFYMGYGSYGPREGIKFFGSKPEDFTWQHAAKLGGQGLKAHKLPKTLITDVWKCTTSRQAQFDGMTRRLDPGTLTIALMGLIVAICATLEDYQQRRDVHGVVQVARFEETDTAAP